MRRDRLMLVLFPALALVSPVLESFGTLSIPLFTLPSLLLTGSLAALGLLLGGAAALLLPDGQSRIPRHILFVGTLVATALVILDVAVGGHRLLSAIAGSRLGRLGALVLLCGLLFAPLWMFRRRAAPLLFVAAAAFFGSTVVLNLPVFATGSEAAPIPAPSRRVTDKPPFIYIVADGAMGVEGLEVAPGGKALAGELRRLFERHGFRLHGGAFSRHFVSGRSIPNVLNFDFRDNTWGPILRHHTELKVRSALFEGLASDGYDVVSYGTEHIDLCFPVATRCEVLPSFNPFSPYIDNDQLKTRALFQLVWIAFGRSYLLYRSSAFLFSFTGGGRPSPFAGIDAYAFPRWFDRFERDVAAASGGHAYFAHLLMPHAPYVFDGACQETRTAVVAYFLTEDRKLTGAALDEVRKDGHRDYQEQYRCLVSRLERLLTRLETAPQFEDATIVIHGDHGPRISAGQYVENVSARDMIDNYSALYAIRSPKVKPGYDSRKTSVQRLTAEYFSRPGADLGPDDPTVAIDSKENGRVVVRLMPDFGSAVSR